MCHNIYSILEKKTLKMSELQIEKQNHETIATFPKGRVQSFTSYEKQPKNEDAGRQQELIVRRKGFRVS